MKYIIHLRELRVSRLIFVVCIAHHFRNRFRNHKERDVQLPLQEVRDDAFDVSDRCGDTAINKNFMKHCADNLPH